MRFRRRLSAETESAEFCLSYAGPIRLGAASYYLRGNALS